MLPSLKNFSGDAFHISEFDCACEIAGNAVNACRPLFSSYGQLIATGKSLRPGTSLFIAAETTQQPNPHETFSIHLVATSTPNSNPKQSMDINQGTATAGYNRFLLLIAGLGGSLPPSWTGLAAPKKRRTQATTW
jgi:hypothetical protein